ncbi:tyrosine-type recombinase/integrase [Kitasatospora sp. NPDC059827]|uniref:tyrosine-type recombinase/integrase n=1 Tax=Kitasatospora sp. NPDC059827 TaxID=3346964 RepID=UPI00365F2F73
MSERESKKDGPGSVYRRCTCREPVLDEDRQPVLDAQGKPRMRELGSRCPKLKGKKAHGTWWYYLKLKPGPDGKPNRDRKGGYEDKDAALAALKKAIAKVDRGEVIDHRTTVAQYLIKWLDQRKTLEPTTASSYESHLRIYLIPALGHIKLEDLTAEPIADMFDAIQARNVVIAYELALIAQARTEYAEWKALYGRKPGRPKRNAQPPPVPAPEIPKREPHAQMRIVSPATMQRIRATLRSALTAAVKKGQISRNWASLVDLPSGKRPKALLWTPERVEAWRRTGEKPSKVMVWTPEQAGQFLDGIEGDWLRAFWHLAIFRGLRRGEAAGFEWSKANLETAVITVDWQVVTVGGKPLGKKPKADSERTLALDSHTLQEMRDHRDRMAEARRDAAEAGRAWPVTDKVFVREDGSEINPDYLTDRFELLCKKLGLPPVRLHDLRHLAATLLLGAGADLKVVQEVLGHATYVLTADTYTSVLPSLDRENAEKAAALVPVKSRSSTSAPLVYLLVLGGIEVAMTNAEDAHAIVDLWNELLAHGYAGLKERPAMMPKKRTRWSGRGVLWERQPRHQQLHSAVAGVDRRSGAVIYQLPLLEQPCFEFERDLYTDQAAVSSVQLRHGLRGTIEVVARGTDEAAVESAFEHALEQAAQMHTASAPEGDDDQLQGDIVAT